MDILVTNNPLVLANFEKEFRIEFVDASLLDIFLLVRDYVHKGHSLLTHPLSGSIKPNETIYKTVLISADSGVVDEKSERIIGDCILKAQSFEPREIPAMYLKELQIVDFSLTRSAVSKA